MKSLLLLFFIIICSCFVYADIYYNTTWNPIETNATYSTPLDGVNCTDVITYDLKLEIIGGNHSNNYTFTPSTPTTYTLCDEDLDCTGTNNTCNLSKVCSIATTTTVVETPTSNTGSSGGGGGGSSDTTNCNIDGFIEFRGYCINDTRIQSFLFNKLETQYCTGTYTTIKVKILDNENNPKIIKKVVGEINNKKYEFFRIGYEYILSENLNLNPGNYSIKIIATDTLIGIDYDMTITEPIEIKQCSYDFDFLQDVSSGIIEKAKSGFSGWSTDNIKDSFQKNQQLLLIILAIFAICIFIIIIISKGGTNEKEE